MIKYKAKCKEPTNFQGVHSTTRISSKNQIKKQFLIRKRVAKRQHDELQQRNIQIANKLKREHKYKTQLQSNHQNNKLTQKVLFSDFSIGLLMIEKSCIK